MTIKALFLIPDRGRLGGCEAYRLMYPARAIEMLGAEVTIIDMEQLAEELVSGRNIVLLHDLVVMHRTVVMNDKEKEALKKSMIAMRANGVAVVVDYDDDYTNQHRHVHEGSLPDYSLFNAVSVSTPELVKLMKGFDANVVHHKNGIVPELMDAARYLRVIKGLSVGLTGSASHKNDWLPAEQAVLELVEEGLPITIFVSGYIPESLKNKKNVVTMRDLMPGVDRDDFFVPLNSYGGIHANIDILLCPVNPDDKFNYYKSNLKAIEGMASRRDVGGKPGGSCVIATGGNLPIYKDAVIHEKTGLLIEDHHSVAEWKVAIAKVAMNVELRNKLQIAGHQLCMKRFDVTKLARERLATYQQLVSEAKREASRWEAELAQMEKIS